MKYEILSIDDYKTALRGEINGLIYHNPTDDELELFETYVSNYLSNTIDTGKKPDLTGICCALLDCKKENFRACDECGEYYLPHEFNDECMGNFCLNCKPYRDPDNEPFGHDDPLTFDEIG